VQKFLLFDLCQYGGCDREITLNACVQHVYPVYGARCVGT